MTTDLIFDLTSGQLLDTKGNAIGDPNGIPVLEIRRSSTTIWSIAIQPGGADITVEIGAKRNKQLETPTILEAHADTDTNGTARLNIPTEVDAIDSFLNTPSGLVNGYIKLWLQVRATTTDGSKHVSNMVPLIFRTDLLHPRSSPPVSLPIAGINTLGAMQVSADSSLSIDPEGRANLKLAEDGSILRKEDGSLYVPGGTDPGQQLYTYVSPGTNGDSSMASAVVKMRPSLIPYGGNTIRIRSLTLGLFWQTEGDAQQIKLSWTENGQVKTALSTSREYRGSINGVSDAYKYLFDDISVTGELTIESSTGNPLDGGWTSTDTVDDSPMISDQNGYIESVFCGVEFINEFMEWQGGYVPKETTFAEDVTFKKSVTITENASLPKQTNLIDTTSGTDLTNNRVPNTKQVKDIVAASPSTWKGGSVENLATFEGGATFPKGLNGVVFSTGLNNTYISGILHVQGECKFTRYYPPTSTSSAPGTSLADIDMPNKKQVREIVRAESGGGAGGTIIEYGGRTQFGAAMNLETGLWRITLSAVWIDDNDPDSLGNLLGSHYSTLAQEGIPANCQLISGSAQRGYTSFNAAVAISDHSGSICFVGTETAIQVTQLRAFNLCFIVDYDGSQLWEYDNGNAGYEYTMRAERLR